MADDCAVLRENLPDRLWHALFQQALLCAHDQVRRYRWRGQHGGVLPSGYDADSIASEATAQLFQSGQPHTVKGCGQVRRSLRAPRPLPFKCPANGQPRLADGKPWRADLPLFETCEECIQRKLGRFVHRLIDALHHRMENLVIRNQAHLDELAPRNAQFPTVTNAKRLKSLLLPSPIVRHHPQIVQNHDPDFQRRFLLFLGKERRLKTFYASHCAGVSKPRHLARKLKLSPRIIRNLLKRLRRKLAAFQHLQPEP